MLDRTTEFSGAVRIFRKAAATAASDGGVSVKEDLPTPAASDFLTAAANVAVGFEGTMKLIEQLRELVGRKGLSNDPTAEIGEVAGFFKGDMATLQAELTILQRYADGQAAHSPPAESQLQKHCQCVCAALRKTVERQTREFQEALQQRTVVLREQNARRKKFSHSMGGWSAMAASDSPLFGNHAPPPAYGGPAARSAAATPPRGANGPSPSLLRPPLGASPIPKDGNTNGIAATAAAAPSSNGGADVHIWPPPLPAEQPVAVPASASSGVTAAGGASQLPPPLPLPPGTSAGANGGPRYGAGGTEVPLSRFPTPPQPQQPSLAYGGHGSPADNAAATGAPTSGGKGGGGAMGLRRRPGRDGEAGDAAGGGALSSAAAAAGERRRGWQVQQDMELQQHTRGRLDEARAVERMISELGTMFGRFSQLVAQQEELVVHIEDDVEMAHIFASEGQAHLARYYQIIKGNRGMIIKIFLLLFFFIWLFTIVF